MIYNRTSGSTGPNDTIAATTIISTVTVSSTASVSTPTPAPAPSSAKNTAAAVGAGVGVPMSFALLAALGLLWRQRKYRVGLEEKSDAWEKKYAALEKMKSVRHEGQCLREGGSGHQLEDTGTDYQLDDTGINEADDITNLNLFEMEGTR